MTATDSETETAAEPATPAVPWEEFFRGVEPYVQQLAGRLTRQFPGLELDDARAELLLVRVMGADPEAVTPTRKTRSRRKGTAERQQLASGAT